MFFCPIRGQQAVKSFRVFLHGYHLIAICILAWFVWQGFARGEKSQSQHKMFRKSFSNIGREIRWTFRRYRYSSVFPSVRDLFKDLLPDSPKVAVINFDLTIIKFCSLFLVEVFLDFLHQLLWLKLC